MKLRKFVVGLVASALVVASMATTALASSPSTDTVVTETPSSSSSSSSGSSTAINPDTLAANISGDVIKYDGVDLDPTIPADLAKLSLSTIESAQNAGADFIIKAVDAEDSSNHNGKGVNYQDTITVKFHSSAFKAGMKITVYHQKDDGKWETITPDSVTDGECIVTFTSLSPVVFATEGKSDKTGETDPILPIAAAICLAGVVFFGTKIRYAK